MKDFNKARFLAYGKWDWTLNRNMYRNAAIVILVLFLGATLLAFLGYFLLGKISDDLNGLSILQLTSWLGKISLWSLAIMSGYLFHNMIVKKTQIMELTLPASVREKFCWHVVVNIGGTLAVCIIGFVVSDLLLAILTALFVGTEHVHSLLFLMSDVNGWIENFRLSGEIGINGNMDADEARVLFGYIPDCLNSIMCWLPLMIVGELTFYSGLFSFVNSKKYRHNIPVTIVILIVMGIILGIITIAIAMGTVYVIRQTVDVNSSEFIVDFMSRLINWTIVFFAAELLTGLLLWLGTYKGYKKAQLLKTV